MICEDVFGQALTNLIGYYESVVVEDFLLRDLKFLLHSFYDDLDVNIILKSMIIDYTKRGVDKEDLANLFCHYHHITRPELRDVLVGTNVEDIERLFIDFKL